MSFNVFPAGQFLRCISSKLTDRQYNELIMCNMEARNEWMSNEAISRMGQVAGIGLNLVRKRVKPCMQYETGIVNDDHPVLFLSERARRQD